MIRSPWHRTQPIHDDEHGFTLVEVLVALVVMIAVLIPSALLLSTSTKVLTFSQAKWVASNLLGGAIERDRAAAEAAGAASSTGWSGNPIAPSLPSLSSQTVNGVTFSFSRSVGWCAEQTVNGITNWGDFPNANTAVFGTEVVNGVTVTVYQPPAYGEYVTVSWPSHALGSGQVLPTPTANQETGNALPPITSSGKCPLK